VAADVHSYEEGVEGFHGRVLSEFCVIRGGVGCRRGVWLSVWCLLVPDVGTS